MERRWRELVSFGVTIDNLAESNGEVLFDIVEGSGSISEHGGPVTRLDVR